MGSLYLAELQNLQRCATFKNHPHIVQLTTSWSRSIRRGGTKRRDQDAACQGVAAAAGQGRAEEAQAEALGSAPKLLLHGCEMPRLLQDHHGVLARSDSRCLLGMFHRALPVHWGQGKAN